MDKVICIGRKGISLPEYHDVEVGKYYYYEKTWQGNFEILGNSRFCFDAVEFKKYFITMAEYRNIKINKILE